MDNCNRLRLEYPLIAESSPMVRSTWYCVMIATFGWRFAVKAKPSFLNLTADHLRQIFSPQFANNSVGSRVTYPDYPAANHVGRNGVPQGYSTRLHRPTW